MNHRKFRDFNFLNTFIWGNTSFYPVYVNIYWHVKTANSIPTIEKLIPSLIVFHKITVRQMMAIIHECDLVIDNDSSPSHVATAFGIPTIVLFSQAIREIFRPYHQEKDQHFVFYNDVNCRECELTSCDDRICLDFSSDEVCFQALKMLSLEKSWTPILILYPIIYKKSVFRDTYH